MALCPTNDASTMEQNAYTNANRILNAGNDSIVGYYDKWAKDDDYDKQISPGYGAPRVCYDVIKGYFAGQPDAAILDIGAGTGISGELFKNNGFTNVDALDPSEGMLRKAQEKRLYRRYFKNFFSGSNEFLETNSYDGVISCGAFGGSQVQASAVKEVVRCVKPGGYVCIVTRPGYVDASTEMGQEILRLEEEGEWRRLSETPVPNYLYSFSGIGLLFQVTKEYQ